MGKSKKYSYDEVKKLFESCNLILLSEEYVNQNTKLKYICKKHSDVVQEKTLRSFLQNKGCRLCGLERSANKQRKSIDEIRQEFLNKGYILLSEKYINAHEKLKYKCMIHQDTVMEVTYNNFQQGRYRCRKCLGVVSVHNYDDVKKLFEQRGYILLESSYKNNQTNMRYCCPKHKDKELKISYANLKKGRGCPYCANEKMSGSGHPNWQGGKTSLIRYLRRFADDWAKKQLRDNEKICVISKTFKKIEIHHYNKSFLEIVNEMMEDLNIDLKDNIADYSEDELKRMKAYIKNIHEKVEGVPVNKFVHLLFHQIYGNGNNTKEQFDEFKAMVEEKRLENIYFKNGKSLYSYIYGE